MKPTNKQKPNPFHLNNTSDELIAMASVAAAMALPYLTTGYFAFELNKRLAEMTALKKQIGDLRAEHVSTVATLERRIKSLQAGKSTEANEGIELKLKVKALEREADGKVAELEKRFEILVKLFGLPNVSKTVRDNYLKKRGVRKLLDDAYGGAATRLAHLILQKWDNLNATTKPENDPRRSYRQYVWNTHAEKKQHEKQLRNLRKAFATVNNALIFPGEGRPLTLDELRHVFGFVKDARNMVSLALVDPDFIAQIMATFAAIEAAWTFYSAPTESQGATLEEAKIELDLASEEQKLLKDSIESFVKWMDGVMKTIEGSKEPLMAFQNEIGSVEKTEKINFGTPIANHACSRLVKLLIVIHIAAAKAKNDIRQAYEERLRTMGASPAEGQAQIEDASNRIERLQIATLEAGRAAAIGEANRLRIELDRTKQSLMNAYYGRDVAVQEKENMKAALDGLRQEHHNAMSSYGSALKEKRVLEAELSAHRNRVTELETNHNTSLSEKLELTRQIESLTNRLNEELCAKAAAYRHLEAARSDVEQLQKTKEAADERIDGLQKKHAADVKGLERDHAKKLSEKLKELAETKERFYMMGEEFQDQQSEMEERNRADKGKVADLTQRLKKSQRKAGGHSHELAKLLEDRDFLRMHILQIHRTTVSEDEEESHVIGLQNPHCVCGAVLTFESGGTIGSHLTNCKLAIALGLHTREEVVAFLGGSLSPTDTTAVASDEFMSDVDENDQQQCWYCGEYFDAVFLKDRHARDCRQNTPSSTCICGKILYHGFDNTTVQNHLSRCTSFQGSKDKATCRYCGEYFVKDKYFTGKHVPELKKAGHESMFKGGGNTLRPREVNPDTLQPAPGRAVALTVEALANRFDPSPHAVDGRTNGTLNPATPALRRGEYKDTFPPTPNTGQQRGRQNLGGLGHSRYAPN